MRDIEETEMERMVSEIRKTYKSGVDKDTMKAMKNRLTEQYEELFPDVSSMREYVRMAIARATDDTKPCQPVEIKIDNSVNNVNITNNYTADPIEVPKAATSDPIDANPDRFTSADVIYLEGKLKAHPIFDRILEEQNLYAQGWGKGKITVRMIALIGCLWRTNIKSPCKEFNDPGASPYKAARTFWERSNLLPPIKGKDGKPSPPKIANIQIRGALTVLEGVGFLKKIRSATNQADRQNGNIVCAAYALMNESEWGKKSATLYTTN